MVYTRDQTYEGEWLRNKRHGWGRMTYSDGSYYEVSWYIMRRSTVTTLVLSNDQVKQKTIVYGGYLFQFCCIYTRKF